MIGFMISLGVVLVLQLAVMVGGVKCSIRHDKDTRVGTKEREMGKYWEGIAMGTLVLFVLGVALEIVSVCLYANYVAPNYDRDTKMRCETIDGEFSERLNACYKNGTKIVFNGGEQVYEAE